MIAAADDMTRVDDQLRRAAMAVRKARGEASFTVRPPGRLRPSSVVAIAMVVGLLVVGLPMFLLKSGPEPGIPDPVAGVGAASDVTVPSGPIGTTPGNCPDRQDDLVTTGTMYLGGPASEQNLGADGFLYSLPVGPTPVRVATQMMALAVTGDECAVSGQIDADGTGVTVTISPPWAAAVLTLDVSIAEHDDVVGVTGIGDHADLEINETNGAPAVRFVEGMPPNTATVDVRFKKGDDVWSLLPDPVSAAPIALEVPAVETDRFPDAEVEWVLVVFLDSDGQILDVVGALTP